MESSEPSSLIGFALAQREAVIERGLNTFIEVGEALAAIRDKRLYREQYATFEDYCANRWGWKRAHAYRMIEAAEVVQELSPIGDTPLPTTESQARELVPLRDDPEAMAAVMDAAFAAARAADRQVTARDIATERDRRRNKQSPEELAEVARQAKESAEWARSMQPPDFDPEDNRQRLVERGALRRLCRDVASQLEPAEFIERHDGYLDDRVIALVLEARDWLDRFATEWSNR